MTIEPIFETTIEDEASDIKLPNTYFANALKKVSYRQLKEETLKKTMYFFKKCSIPAPEEPNEYLNGTEGFLIFSNKLGLVIRIEEKKDTIHTCHRINNNGYILKPIASIDIQNLIIEICPTTEVETDARKTTLLRRRLRNTKVNYWDDQTSNSGTIPIKTPNFPNGVTVVIDRLAVKKRFGHAIRIKKALEKEAEKAQDELYSPLRKAFKDAWHNKNKAPKFLSLCQAFKEQGKLIAGWNNLKDPYFKTREAIKSAEQYDKRLSL